MYMAETCVVIKSIYRKLDSEELTARTTRSGRWTHSRSASSGENKTLLHCSERNPVSPVVQPVA